VNARAHSHSWANSLNDFYFWFIFGVYSFQSRNVKEINRHTGGFRGESDHAPVHLSIAIVIVSIDLWRDTSGRTRRETDGFGIPGYMYSLCCHNLNAISLKTSYIHVHRQHKLVNQQRYQLSSLRNSDNYFRFEIFLSFSFSSSFFRTIVTAMQSSYWTLPAFRCRGNTTDPRSEVFAVRWQYFFFRANTTATCRWLAVAVADCDCRSLGN